MSPDDIDAFVLRLADFLFPGDDDDDTYEPLHEFVEQQLEKFITRDRNYN